MTRHLPALLLVVFLLVGGIITGCGSSDDREKTSWDPCCVWHQLCMRLCAGSPYCGPVYTDDPEQCLMGVENSGGCIEMRRQEAIDICSE